MAAQYPPNQLGGLLAHGVGYFAQKIKIIGIKKMSPCYLAKPYLMCGGKGIHRPATQSRSVQSHNARITAAGDIIEALCEFTRLGK